MTAGERIRLAADKLRRTADTVAGYEGPLESLREQQALWKLEEAAHDCEINAIRLRQNT